MENLPDLRSALMMDEYELTLDLNTVRSELSLSEDNRKVTVVKGEYFDDPERYDFYLQVLCREPLTGRCYWEVEMEMEKGGVYIGVTGITAEGQGVNSWLKGEKNSWTLHCSNDDYSVMDNSIRKYKVIDLRPSKRVGVYLDRPAGSLSFYRVSPDGEGFSDTLTHIHTFQSTFTQEDLLPLFVLWEYDSSVSLCRL